MLTRLPTSLRAAIILSLLALAAGGAPAPALASPAAAVSGAPASFTVNIVTDAAADFGNDPGFTVCHTAANNSLCSLRAAIMNANRHNGGAVIQLPAGRYLLQLPPASPFGETNGSFDISNTVSLVGAGAGASIVDGGGLDTVFFITGTATVTMTGLTIQNGFSSFAGGGIAIGVLGQLDLEQSAVLSNTSDAGGAGLRNLGTLTINHSTIAGNVTLDASGGGILNAGTLTVNTSTLSGNTAANFDGGGIHNTGHLTVFDSTISNNRAAKDGGGVFSSGTASFFHTTIAGNLADDDSNGTGQGGGIFIFSSAPAVQLSNSLLANNYSAHTYNMCTGDLASLDYNLMQTINGCNITGTTGHNVEFVPTPGLAELGDFGGPTLTRVLLPGSPALDRIPPDLCRDPAGAAPVPDQRGVARPINGLCDIGADEGLPVSSPYFRNVILNGDAEGSAGSPVGSWVGVADWPGFVGEPTVVSYGAPGGFPAVPTDTHGLSGPPGQNFFAGGLAANSLMSQDDDLPPELLGSIKAGVIKYLFSADLGGFGTQDDNAQVQLRFTNAHTVVGPLITIGPINSAQRGGKTGFVHVAATGLVPAGAIRAFVQLDMTRVFTGSNYNDGYADNISLVLLPNDLVYLPTMLR